MREALDKAGKLYEQLKPYERKELLRLVLRPIELSEREIVLEIYGSDRSDGLHGPLDGSEGLSRSETVSWLPDVDSNHEPSG